MPRREYFREHVTTVAAGGTYDDVEFRPSRVVDIYHIMRFAVEDETSAPSGDIRVGVLGHGYFHQIMDQESPAAAALYFDRWPTFLRQGESFVARFYGATAGDVLQLYLEGWTWTAAPAREGPMRDGSEDRE